MHNLPFKFSGTVDNEQETLAIVPGEDLEELSYDGSPLPLLPLRNMVLFPGVVLPITVGRTKSIRLIREARANDSLVAAVAQRDATVDNPQAADLHQHGTVAKILKTLEMPDGSFTVILQGKQSFVLEKLLETEPYHTAAVTLLPIVRINREDRRMQALIASIKEVALKIITISGREMPDVVMVIKNIDANNFWINYVAASCPMSTEDRQTLLQTVNPQERCNLLLGFLVKELQLLELKQDIQKKVKGDLDKQQREYLLHQQMKTIQAELGDDTPGREIQEMEEKGRAKKWGQAIAAAFTKELRKLERIHPSSAEYATQDNYVRTLLDMPWNEYTKDCFSLADVRRILDEDHFGLEQVKERIVSHLAVLQLKGDMKAPILCLVGPPGVGKTSLGKSIARAMGRKYVRVSIGGLHDEAEIRGHRRTYIGAMPGRIIQYIKKAQSSNPVFVLDEIDKVSASVQGDPASALLEVLDPEQNTAFCDNYLEVEYDLSKVMFVATANSLGTISPALRDRMEVIHIDGYATEEKLAIAERHLLPGRLKEHGLQDSGITMSEETLRCIIDNYTRESGVRELNKQIAAVLRWYATRMAEGLPFEREVTCRQVREILHAPKHIHDSYEGNDYPGVVTGLAWTSAGGEIILVESSLSRGTGNITITGNLGDVMKESAALARSWLKAHPDLLGLDPAVFEQWDMHLHVPEGATPKDGPSAGITMVVSMASAWTRRKVRPRLAMTGEMTLRGKVLPIGGVKEKILAAKRAGITHIILPEENRIDLEEIEPLYLEGLEFIFAGDIRNVLKEALLEELADRPLAVSSASKKKKTS